MIPVRITESTRTFEVRVGNHLVGFVRSWGLEHGRGASEAWALDRWAPGSLKSGTPTEVQPGFYSFFVESFPSAQRAARAVLEKARFGKPVGRLRVEKVVLS